MGVVIWPNRDPVLLSHLGRGTGPYTSHGNYCGTLAADLFISRIFESCASAKDDELAAGVYEYLEVYLLRNVSIV